MASVTRYNKKSQFSSNFFSNILPITKKRRPSLTGKAPVTKILIQIFNTMKLYKPLSINEVRKLHLQT